MAKAKVKSSAKKKPAATASGRRKKSPRVERMIRVDHAGEYGAKRIYQGQMKVLGKNPRLKKLLQEMMDHEQEHLQYFENAIPARRVRPTALLPLWHVGGFAMGAITAVMGEKAAMMRDIVQECAQCAACDVDGFLLRDKAAFTGNDPITQGESGGGNRGDLHIFGGIDSQAKTRAVRVKIGVIQKEVNRAL